MGHGHIIPNPDGTKARGGGPGICEECSAEFAKVQIEKVNAALAPLEEALKTVVRQNKELGYGRMIQLIKVEWTKELIASGIPEPLAKAAVVAI